jgi:hypothetical protein
MLSLPKHVDLSLPNNPLGRHLDLRLSPVPVSDEADMMYQSQPSMPGRDDDWEMSASPDGDELQEFWSHVEEDAQYDHGRKVSLSADRE